MAARRRPPAERLDSSQAASSGLSLKDSRLTESEAAFQAGPGAGLAHAGPIEAARARTRARKDRSMLYFLIIGSSPREDIVALLPAPRNRNPAD
jgi:hypothetical protein